MGTDLMHNKPDSSEHNSTLGGLIWKFGERITAQLVSTVVTIILARLLTPSDYGVVALVTIFITICNTLVTGGLGNALIQKKDADETDFSSMFYFSVFMSIILYFVMFFTAVPIAKFYNKPQLIPIIRVMSLRLPFAAANSIQQAFISRRMQFRKFFVATIIGTIISAVVGIYMAYKGYGPWALVMQYLTNVFIDTFVLFLVGGWRPKFLFSIGRVKGMLPYGLRIMGASLLDTVFNEIRSIVISAKYSDVDLAMYENGKKYPNLIVTNINSSITSVMLPVLSKKQNDTLQIKATMKKSIKVSAYLLAPLLLGFLVCADRFVDVILTDKWADCVPYICLMCVMCLFYPIHTINIQAVNAVGRSDLTLRLEVIKKIFNIVVLIITMLLGVFWIAFGALVVSLASTYINAAYSKKLFNYSFAEQIFDIIPSLLLSLIMGLAVFAFDRLVVLDSTFMLIADVMIGAFVYLVASVILKPEPFKIITEEFKHFTKRFNKRV